MSRAKASIILILVLSGLSSAASVKTGLDNVGSYKQLFQGKRVGIVTNHTAYGSNGQYIVDIFRNMDKVTVVALFGPEHGLYGVEGPGTKIANQIHPVYRVPVYSLYGNTRKPTQQMLKDIDVLIFDIQDIGARFYTYIYTMSLAMEAAAEYGKRFVVLDRPNPINGIQVEGDILQPQFASFVGLYPIPVRHGMTAGELAKMFNEEGWLANGNKADLSVIPMQGWRRSYWYDQTGLSFIKPSPNIPNLETAILYPGLCLLEGTNVSEGRGTALPFRQFGAPWIDSKRLSAQLNKLNLKGLRFEPTTFTPVSSKYKHQKCNGSRIVITERNLIEPYWIGIQIVNEIYQMHPDAFQWRAQHFDHLCGTSAIREAIVIRSSLKKTRENWQAELKAFLRIRNNYLMYSN
ncbi:MAG: exo-beta-N-acetylmuramidase NamZ domain-containing protein [Phycisphaerae bacterium]